MYRGVPAKLHEYLSSALYDSYRLLAFWFYRLGMWGRCPMRTKHVGPTEEFFKDLTAFRVLESGFISRKLQTLNASTKPARYCQYRSANGNA